MRAESGSHAEPVVAERVFRAQHWAIYALLTLAQLTLFALLLTHARWWWLGVLVVVPGLCLYPGRWASLPLMRRPHFRPAQPGLRVAVATSFVPGSEPFEMLYQTVSALVALRYPHDTWILDEGNDDRVKALCTELGAHYFTRRAYPEREVVDGSYAMGTKHGNYNVWLDEIGDDRYDIVVNFDPDHIPRSDFLERTLGYFEDPGIGYVQAAQVYYNQTAGLVARGAAEETYTYYSSFQMSSYALGYPIVTGSHTVHRLTALREVGGYAPHEADDLLITMLYRAAGWKGVYVPETLARGITPTDWPSYLVQQRRWARSVLDIKVRWFKKSAGDLSIVESTVSLLQGLSYLSGVGIALGVVGVSVLLASGSHVVDADHQTLILAGLLAAAWFAGELFRQWFCLNRHEEFGLQLRAKLLRFAKWPWFVAAIADVARGPHEGYTMTRKTARGSRRLSLVRPHLAAVAVVVFAALVGIARDHYATALTNVIAGAFVLASLVVVASELPRPPAPYDPLLAVSRGWPPPERPERLQGRRTVSFPEESAAMPPTPTDEYVRFRPK